MFEYFHCLIMLIVTINYLLTYPATRSAWPRLAGVLLLNPMQSYAVLIGTPDRIDIQRIKKNSVVQFDVQRYCRPG